MAAEFRGAVYSAGFHQPARAVGVECDRAQRAVLVAYSHHQFGLSIVTWGDHCTVDDRLSHEASRGLAAAR